MEGEKGVMKELREREKYLVLPSTPPGISLFSLLYARPSGKAELLRRRRRRRRMWRRRSKPLPSTASTLTCFSVHLLVGNVLIPESLR